MSCVRSEWAIVALGFALTAACGYGLHDDYGSDACPGDDDCATSVGASGTTATSSTGSGSTSAGTSATGSTGGVDDGATTVCQFICPDDMAGEQKCDIFAQDCPEGQKCAPYDSIGDNVWDDVQCVDVIGDGQHGDPCLAEAIQSGVDDCAEGLMCWNLNVDGEGSCVAMCAGTLERPICEPLNTTCHISGNGVLNLCLARCDPLLQDCPDTRLCIPKPNSDGFWCVPDASGGMTPEGTPCEFNNACNAGLMCVNSDFYPNPACEGATGCCAPFCDLENADSCDGLSVADAGCVPFFEPGEAPPGYANVGVCGVAP